MIAVAPSAASHPDPDHGRQDHHEDGGDQGRGERDHRVVPQLEPADAGQADHARRRRPASHRGSTAIARIASAVTNHGEPASTYSQLVDDRVGEPSEMDAVAPAQFVGDPVDGALHAVGRSGRRATTPTAWRRRRSAGRGRRATIVSTAPPSSSRLRRAAVSWAWPRARLLGVLAGGGGDPVEHDRHQHDAEPGDERVADAQRVQGADDRLAEAGAVDEGRDRRHRQCRHRGLVDADDDGPLGHRQLDLGQPLPLRLPHRVGRLEVRRGEVLQAVRRDPHHRRQRVDQRADRRRPAAPIPNSSISGSR